MGFQLARRRSLAAAAASTTTAYLGWTQARGSIHWAFVSAFAGAASSSGQAGRVQPSLVQQLQLVA